MRFALPAARVITLAVATLMVVTATPAGAAPAAGVKAASVKAAVSGPVTVTAPSRVKNGASATIKVTAASGDDGTATLYSRSSAGEWQAFGSAITITDGEGSATVNITASRAFKVQTDGGATSRIFGISLEDSSRRAVTGSLTSPTYAAGELMWLRGTAYKSGVAYKSAKITIERSAIGSSSWSTLGTTSTSSSGSYAYRLNPSSTYRYRAVITGTYARSAPATVENLSGDRTLEGRGAALSAVIGSPTGSAHSVPSGDIPSGVSSARYQQFANGILVEVTTSTSVRTWWVYDRIGSKYTSLDRWHGKLGLPMRDAKCGLLEGGCVQRFTGGSVYQNSNKSGAYVAYGSMPETELLATAFSQANYVEPSWRKNKFNSWVGASNAWCSVFMSWVGAASGNSTWIPKRTSYDTFVATLKASGKLHYSGTPPVGALVLYDWQTGHPSHSGLVRGISGSNIFTIEGNTSDGKGHPERGVWYRSRAIADVWAWYIPHDYPN